MGTNETQGNGFAGGHAQTGVEGCLGGVHVIETFDGWPGAEEPPLASRNPPCPFLDLDSCIYLGT